MFQEKNSTLLFTINASGVLYTYILWIHASTGVVNEQVYKHTLEDETERQHLHYVIVIVIKQ